MQTDKTKESLAEINKELRDIGSARPVTNPELEAAIGNRTLKLPGARESLRAVTSTVQQIVEFGYPDDYFDTYAAKVRGLRPADIQDVARTVVHPDNLIWVLVGDRAKIEAGVCALDIGEFHLIDSDGKPVN